MPGMSVGTKEYFNVVIVGHVDHGKSTLIGRLLYDTDSIAPDKLETVRQACEEFGVPFEFAFITDQIREEREQGITIDTTQIYFHTDARNYVIIDAPGHREFTKNMITGASQAEGAILVIDGVEGVREQTRRHAYLLKFLGLRENIVLVNKMDLAGYREETFETVKAEITAFLTELGVTRFTIIPISAARGDNIASRSENMPWYTGPTALEALDALQKRELLEGRGLRLPVQDIYDVDGERIIAGRIESGRLRDGDRLILWPAGVPVIVAGVREFGRERHDAECGEGIGLVLVEPVEIKRGMLLTDAGARPAITQSLHASVFWMSPYPVRVGDPLTFRCTTQEIPCRIASIARRIDSSTLELLEENAEMLKDTEVGEVVIELDAPVITEPYAEIPELGRFVLERTNTIVAGGIISG